MIRIVKLLRGYCSYIKRKRFMTEFASFGKNSGFGLLGYGDDCRIWDKARISIGDNSWFGRKTIIQVLNGYSYPDGEQVFSSRLSIGNNVRSTERCNILCAGNMIIEDDVLIAPNVYITDNNHGMFPDVRGYRCQPLSVKNVKICRGVWIGQGAYILPGVTIGEHSIIAAGAIVTHDIPAYSIACGIPAKVIKQWDSVDEVWKRL